MSYEYGRGLWRSVTVRRDLGSEEGVEEEEGIKEEEKEVRLRARVVQ